MDQTQEIDIEQYTVAQMQEAATFRVWPLDWTLRQFDSGAIAVQLRLAIHQRWHGKEAGWSQVYDPGWYTDASIWIETVPKDKAGNPIAGAAPQMNENGIKRLGELLGWDGDYGAFEGPVPRTLLLADIEGEEYNGKVSWRANWLNPNADEPKPRGAFAPVDKGLLNTLRSKHQAKARALLAGSSGAPVPAPTPATAPTPAPAQEATAAPAPADNAAPPSPAAAPVSEMPAVTQPAPVNTAQPATGAPAAAAAPTTAPASAAPPAAGTEGNPQPPAWGGGDGAQPSSTSQETQQADPNSPPF